MCYDKWQKFTPLNNFASSKIALLNKIFDFLLLSAKDLTGHLTG